MIKRIVVLSDGTGNSAAKLAKTNVWRTYQVLRLHDGTQLAKYDDGVGSSSIKLLALLGGVIGWGLKRNVLDLYKFICMNYQSGIDIFGFGFSRGAFTIRVLVALIESQGLVRADSEEILMAWAKEAYRRYRRSCYTRPTLFGLVGACWGRATALLREKVLGFPRYDAAQNLHHIPIRFLGLWDTVDAYGIPIKELRKGIDMWIWPLGFESQELSLNVRKACHALALDDERATFHPLLWEETAEDRASGRIEQVWFAGMHSNVGGGYPDDGMAYVPLIWILEKAQAAGLELDPTLLAQYRGCASPFGRMYDSRANLLAYYRYAPRILPSSPPPRIHPSVYQRISNRGNRYAPISVPPPQNRRQYHELVWDTVWWRRVTYWVMVILSATLVALPLLEADVPFLDKYFRDFVETLASWLRVFIPKFGEPWVEGAAQKPAAVVILLIAILATYCWGRVVEGRIRDRAREIWHPNPKGRQKWLELSKRRSIGVAAAIAGVAASSLIAIQSLNWALLPAGLIVVGVVRYWRADRRLKKFLRSAAAPVEPPGASLKFARKVRTYKLTIRAWRTVSNSLIPTAFALITAFVGVAALNRMGFVALNLFDIVCTGSDQPRQMKVGEAVVLNFETKLGCMPTGLQLQKGGSYRIEFSEIAGWKDPPTEVKDAQGFNSSHPQAPWYMGIAVPFRRVISADWFVPLAHIGNHSLSDRSLTPMTTLENVPRDGELFLAVNDAIIGWPFIWDHFYTSGGGHANEGTAKVTIRRLENGRDLGGCSQ